MIYCQLTQNEYDAVLEARNYLIENELNNLLITISMINEDINSNLFYGLLEADDVKNDQNNNSDQNNTNNATNNVDQQNNKDDKTEVANKDEKKDKNLVSTIKDKIAKLIDIIAKFIKGIFPKVKEKTEQVLNNASEKTINQSFEANFIKQDTMNETANYLNLLNKNNMKNNVPEDNIMILKKAISYFNEVKPKIDSKDQEVVEIIKINENNFEKFKVKANQRTENITKVTNILEPAIQKLKELSNTNPNNALSGLIVAYSGALYVLKSDIKFIIEGLKALNAATKPNEENIEQQKSMDQA